MSRGQVTTTPLQPRPVRAKLSHGPQHQHGNQLVPRTGLGAQLYILCVNAVREGWCGGITRRSQWLYVLFSQSMFLYVCTQQAHATKRSPSGATAPHEPEDQAHINCKTHSGKAAEASGRHRTYGRDFGPPRQLGARNNIPLRNLNGLKGAMAQSRRSVCAVR